MGQPREKEKKRFGISRLAASRRWRRVCCGRAKGPGVVVMLLLTFRRDAYKCRHQQYAMRGTSSQCISLGMHRPKKKKK